MVWKIGGPCGLDQATLDWLTDFFANGGKISDLFPEDEKLDDDDDDAFGMSKNLKNFLKKHCFF